MNEGKNLKMNKEIINAQGESLGRTASKAAKLALLGREVIILNCSKAIITGNKYTTINLYLRKRKIGGHSQKGPYFPSSPDKIMKRTIRGMLPYKKGRGSDALEKIRCYNEVPLDLKDKIKKSEKNKIGIEVGEVSRRIG